MLRFYAAAATEGLTPMTPIGPIQDADGFARIRRERMESYMFDWIG
jgi:hypothetical protein